MVNIGDQVDALVERLKVRVDTESKVKVLSIVGFGGVGKQGRRYSMGGGCSGTRSIKFFSYTLPFSLCVHPLNTNLI